MEIETAPRPPGPTPWGRLLVLVALLAPVTLLVLLPIGLGLDRYVMTGDSMSGSLDRGTLAYERVVPLSDVRKGDIVTYERPGPGHSHVLVTHRVVAIGDTGLVTRGDAESADDPWVLPLDQPTISRVEFTVPLIGWAYLLFFGPTGWLLTGASAIALLVLTRRRTRRPALVEPPDAPTPAARRPADVEDAVRGATVGQ